MATSSEVIFSTVAGSWLYGMNGPHSDIDTYTVVLSRSRAAQRMSRNPDGSESDTVTIGWYTFLEYAFSGSHQSVEAMFSKEKVWGSEQFRLQFEPLLNGYRVTGPDVLSKYGRTITKFAHADDFKRRRHACRLWLNMQELRTEGRFDPRMTPEQIAWATELATSDIGGDELSLLLWEGSSAMGDFLHE